MECSICEIDAFDDFNNICQKCYQNICDKCSKDCCQQTYCFNCLEHCQVCNKLLCLDCLIPIDKCSCCNKETKKYLICIDCQIITWFSNKIDKKFRCLPCQKNCYHLNKCSLTEILKGQQYCPVCYENFDDLEKENKVDLNNCLLHLCCQNCLRTLTDHRCPICRQV